MNISVTDFYNKVQAGDFEHWVDVRTTAEFNSERADCMLMKNHPLSEIETLNLPKDSEIYLSCHTGARSSKAQKRLQELGYTRVINIEGGLLAWRAAKLPLAETKVEIPIMRQVQLAMSVLILIGTLGSLYLNPAFIWLAVFVGLGAGVAGISGWCGMAHILGVMPWNKTGCA